MAIAIFGVDTAPAVVGLPVATRPHRPSAIIVAPRSRIGPAARHPYRRSIDQPSSADAVTERWTAGEWRDPPRPSPDTDLIETRPRAHQTWEDAPEDSGPN